MALFGLFESDSELLERLHNEGQADGASSETSVVFGESNKHLPNPLADFFNVDSEDNDAYMSGFNNGKDQQK